MRVLAINGSPRKTWNTATLLQSALDGAASVGAETTLAHLGDLRFRGCISCFACKRKDTKFRGACALQDEATPLLEEAMQSEVVFFGSPVYVGDVTGILRCFWERFIFMNASYEKDGGSNFNGRIRAVGFLYTMNVPEEAGNAQYGPIFTMMESFVRRFNWRVARHCAYDTWQFDDYAKYEASRFDARHKETVRREQFPKDLAAAFTMGAELAAGV